MVKEIENKEEISPGLGLGSETGELEGHTAVLLLKKAISAIKQFWGKLKFLVLPSHSSLYIDDASVRLMVIKGNKITKYAELSLEPGLVKDGVIPNPALMGEKIESLLRLHRVSGRKLIIGFSGVHCLSRIISLPLLSNNLLTEAIYHEAKRELPVSLENLYLAWQVIHISEKDTKIFLIAYARNIVDSLIYTMKNARIKPYIMDLTPLAITRVLGEKTAAIVDIRSSGMDIVVMVDGIPELIRSLPLPQEKSWLEKLPIIKDELERTIKFYEVDKYDNLSTNKLQVFVVGELLDDSELYCALSDTLGHSFPSPSLPLTCPDEFKIGRYMVNIGLILKKLTLVKTVNPSLVNINALPEIYRVRQVNVERVLTIGGAAVAASVIIGTAMMVQNLASQIESGQAELKASSQMLVLKQTQQKSLNDSIISIEKNLTEAAQTYETLNAARASLTSQQATVNGDLSLATSALTINMALTSVKHTGSLLTVTGTAPSEEEILKYAADLSSSDRYAEIIIYSLQKIINDKGQIINFTLNMRTRG